MLFISFSIKVGIMVPAWVNLNLSSTLPFFRTTDLDLVGLKLILTHEMSLSRPHSIHLQPWTD